MRKLMLLGAIVVVVLLAAAPAALGQAAQGFSEKRITSGANTPKIEVKNSGNNANLCPTVQQASNTGNVANEQGVVQDRSKVDDISFAGSEITITPSTTAECTQTLEQAAAAK